MDEKLVITLDTNCINSRSASSHLNGLEDFHARGQIRLVKTDVMNTEMNGWIGPGGDRARAKSEGLDEDIGVFVIGHSRIGYATIGGDSDAELYESVAQVIFCEPSLKRLDTQSVRDVMTVGTHIKHGRDIFVTTDGAILRAAPSLLERFGTVVMNPEACVTHVESLALGH